MCWLFGKWNGRESCPAGTLADAPRRRWSYGQTSWGSRRPWSHLSGNKHEWSVDRRTNVEPPPTPPPPPESNLPQRTVITPPKHSCPNLVSCLSTCIATALLPPGGHVALVTAAAAADLCPLVQRACCGVLTCPAAQRCCCHCALQLGGGERVGHAARAHRRLEAVRQLTLKGQTRGVSLCRGWSDEQTFHFLNANSIQRPCSPA